MTVNSFEREESNANVDSAQYYIDSDGSFKFISPILASSNFDGSIPIFERAVYADELESGMLIKLSDSQYYPIIDIFKDDPDLEDTPSDIITVNYIDANTETQTISFDSSESIAIEVRYENWSEKYLGSQGWALTYGGNAIFANVGVRGEIEATTLDVGGVNGITYDGSTVVIGASVVVNAPIEFNGVTPEELDAELSNYVTGGQLTDNTTTISGGNIKTGTIQSAGFATPTAPYKYDGSEFATNGMAIVLAGENSGAVIAKNFKINPNGNASFKGTLSGASIDTSEGILLSTNNISASFGGAGISVVSNPSDLQLNLRSPWWGSNTSGPTSINLLNSATERLITLNGMAIITNNLNVGGIISGNGSGLTNLNAGSPIVVSTSGPRDPDAYADDTVWYVI